MKNQEKLSYCAELVCAHKPELYWLALFVPEPAREGLLRLYALETELFHLRGMIREEMIGRIRYAWWREALEALFEGRPKPGHPVLEALAEIQLPKAEMMALLDAYESTYPAEALGAPAAREVMSLAFLQSAAPEAATPWKKASAIMARHRARWGNRMSNWLLFKLLLTGAMPR